MVTGVGRWGKHGGEARLLRDVMSITGFDCPVSMTCRSTNAALLKIRDGTAKDGTDHEQRMMAHSTASAAGRIFGETDEQYRWLDGLLRALILLNLADALFTLWWINAGLAVEANVLMRDLVDHGALTFVLAKIGLVSLGALFLWLRRTHALAVCAVLVTFLAYYLVFLYHLQFTSGLVITRFGL